MKNPNDEIREKILKCMYDFFKKANSINNARITDVMVEREIVSQGYSHSDFISNFLYLISTGYIKKETESYSYEGFDYKTNKSKAMRGKQHYYTISDKGVNHFEGASQFQKSTWVTGINVTNVQGVTVIGDNNYVRNEYNDLYNNLDLLSDEIRKSASISDEDKISYTADIDTIKSQLAKPNPVKQVIATIWTGLSLLANVEGVAQFYERVNHLIAPFLHH